MTADRERQLRSTQRRMLRCMVRVGRRYVSYNGEHGQVQTLDGRNCSEDSSGDSSESDEVGTSSHDIELESYA
eukprot:4424819-Karenia_brevis.AAC.1